MGFFIFGQGQRRWSQGIGKSTRTTPLMRTKREDGGPTHERTTERRMKRECFALYSFITIYLIYSSIVIMCEWNIYSMCVQHIIEHWFNVFVLQINWNSCFLDKADGRKSWRTRVNSSINGLLTRGQWNYGLHKEPWWTMGFIKNCDEL